MICSCSSTPSSGRVKLRDRLARGLERLVWWAVFQTRTAASVFCLKTEPPGSHKHMMLFFASAEQRLAALVLSSRCRSSWAVYAAIATFSAFACCSSIQVLASIATSIRASRWRSEKQSE